MIRTVVGTAAEGTGLNRVSRLLTRRRPLILCFHGVSRERANVPDPDGIHIPQRLFRKQLEVLLKWFNPVTLQDVADWTRGNLELPSNSVHLTFDDGYRNVVVNAIPLLAEQKVPASVYIVAGAVEGPGLWLSRLELKYQASRELPAIKARFKRMSAAERVERLAQEDLPVVPRESDHSLMDWSELGLLRETPGIAIGSHGLTHHPLTTCDEGLREKELTDSKALLRLRLGIETTTIAYPNGDWTPEVAAETKAAGYDLALSTQPWRCDRRADFVQPRILVGRDDSPRVLGTRVAGWLDPVQKRRSASG